MLNIPETVIKLREFPLYISSRRAVHIIAQLTLEGDTVRQPILNRNRTRDTGSARFIAPWTVTEPGQFHQVGKPFLLRDALHTHFGHADDREAEIVKERITIRPRVVRIQRSELPTQQDIAVGRTVQYMNESGGMVNFIILAADEETVTLDANHPFAGQTLRYELTLVAVY